jgi:multidrug efflux pump subunit AcrB
MLAGTLVTIIGLMPVGFAKSSAGEYAGNIFWVVAFALITSWFVAVIFTPYLGVKLLPKIKPVEGGHAAIYDTPRYRQFRGLIGWTVANRLKVVLGVVAALVVSFLMMGMVKQQFFPISDRPEVLIEVQTPEGSSIETTSQATAKVEALAEQAGRRPRSSPAISARARRASSWPCRPSCLIRPSPRSWC